MDTKFFKIFRVGMHTTSSGEPINFTEIDLLRTVQRFNAKKTDIPLVPGHPENDQPVMGYVKSLVLKDGFLFALADVSEELVNRVKTGFNKFVSAKFTRTRNPDSPSEFFYDLRHVGFLGPDRNPGCKGLGQLSFATPEAPRFMGGAQVVAFASFDDKGDVLRFSEGPLRGWGVDPRTQSKHQAAMQISATYTEYSYLEAVRFLESV